MSCSDNAEVVIPPCSEGAEVVISMCSDNTEATKSTGDNNSPQPQQDRLVTVAMVAKAQALSNTMYVIILSQTCECYKTTSREDDSINWLPVTNSHNSIAFEQVHYHQRNVLVTL